MRRLRYNVAVSLDGFIASPDGTTDWIVEDTSIDFAALYASFSTFVMGRKTYETMQAYGEQNPLRAMTRDALIVVSKSMKAEEHPEVTIVAERVEEFVEQLKGAAGSGGGVARDIWLFGGGQLATCLLNAGLVDTVETAIMPVLIGEGVKMVGGSAAGDKKTTMKLSLESTRRLSGSGILMCTYLVASLPAAPGSCGSDLHR
ncbi:riboflavin biosynthesis protein RibD domain-containing protein [Aaosphaeria arxii CBS 175.79]|uniref:2,5-diamino-6-ribosylamino-4(3H)-pyrimidinone 5'-phosphate reductase n=1 Tax=Aaosphaeria arxii CBS 175.79 TaxID=1450172 RepID=A0A6A5XP72_9PLEO|nr:riboflavin biosynthesis protein RibD domain-containing protein [Aaosphaeria arxii CBS 175.79]KAF2014561.1 riboflavin biosynthesis protein RibD domain-containing protein [Aaosphaeria arxii CBS 175.79]